MQQLTRRIFIEKNELDLYRLGSFTHNTGQALRFYPGPSLRALRRPVQVPRTHVFQIKDTLRFLTRPEGAEVDLPRAYVQNRMKAVIACSGRCAFSLRRLRFRRVDHNPRKTRIHNDQKENGY